MANYRDEKQDTRGTAMLLAELGADLEAKNKQGETPLQVSEREGHHQMTQVLSELERARKAASKHTTQPQARAAVGRAPTIEEIAAMGVKELKTYLNERGVDFAGCCEKSDMRALAVKSSLGALAEVVVKAVDLSGAEKGGGGGGPSGKAGASAAASSCQASSPQGSSRPSELRPESSGLHTTQDAVQAALSVAVAMRGAQQSNPQPQPASDSKKQDKERQRKERQLQRKMDVAKKALRTAMAAVEKYGVRCVCTPAPSPLASATLAWHTDVAGVRLFCAARARCVRWKRRRRRRRGTRLAARCWQR